MKRVYCLYRVSTAQQVDVVNAIKKGLFTAPQITDKGIRTRVLTLLSSLQEVASVVEYRSKKE